MDVLLSLSALALRQVLKGATEWNFAKTGVNGGERLTGLLLGHFTDHSLKLTQALSRANDRAWKGLEMALLGDSWWHRVKNALVPAEARAFQQQVESWLDRTPLSDSDTNTQIRQLCVRELQSARDRGLLTGGELDFEQLSEQLGHFARFDQPHEILESEWRIIGNVGERLKQAGYANLAWFTALRPPQGDSLLVIGVRYFFRREVEANDELFRGLTITKLETLSQAQEESFANLEKQLGELKAAVGKIQVGVESIQAGVSQVQSGISGVQGDLLDLKAELQRQSQQHAEFCKTVLQVLEQHQLTHRQMTVRDGHSIDKDRDRKMVRDLLNDYRTLPEEKRRQMPALLNALAKLRVGVGDFAAARQDFQTVAALLPQPGAQADVFVNEYFTALEQQDWDGGMAALRKAMTADPKRFAPFRLDRYEPLKILGAGGFGVAFLCRDRILNSKVVIKVLRPDTLARSIDDVFREAQLLDHLNHPAIVRLRHCDFADVEQTRPFLVMDYFEGQSLAEYVEQNGPLSNQDLVAVAALLAEGLQAAHQQNILHRDVKPHNVLVRRQETERASGGRQPPVARWQVKIIDFGLAMEQEMLTGAKSGSYGRSALGKSIAGTRDYASPEQLGQLPFPVGKTSDVYGFGKTCCFARFGTVNLLPKHWESLPRQLADLLAECLESPEKRPNGFARVLDKLRRPDLLEHIETVLPVHDEAPVPGPKRPTTKPAKTAKQPAAKPQGRTLPPIIQPIDEAPEVLVPIDVLEPVELIQPIVEKNVEVRLLFRGAPKVGILDSKVEVTLDGKFVGWGTLSKGFAIDTRTTVGKHRVHLQMTVLARLIEVELPEPGKYEVCFVYDPVWGVTNFLAQAEVHPLS